MRITACGILLVMAATGSTAFAQCEPGPEVSGRPVTSTDWQAAAGGKMSFEVASVKASMSNADPTSNFPLGPGDVFAAVGGRFCAANTTVMAYIGFAHKLSNQQRQSITGVPAWLNNEGFDIEAKGPGGATKDQMRLMIQALLADRFKLVLRHEVRQTPVLTLIAKSGKFGPQLKLHVEDVPCNQSSLSTPASRLEQLTCGGIFFMMPNSPGLLHIGARDVPLSVLAGWLTNRFTGIDRAVFDNTGMNGNVDFSLEFSPILNPAQPVPRPDDTGPTFLQALQDQLGLKLESTTKPVEGLVVDHVEHPSEN
jgi:uncharacterized protein (TIGR03435 family)